MKKTLHNVGGGNYVGGVNFVPIPPSVEHTTNNVSLYAESVYDADLLCELMTSLLITGIQMGEMSKLG
jgi:hypothetical protein